MRPALVLLMLGVLLGASACGGSEREPPTRGERDRDAAPPATTTAEAPATDAAGCVMVDGPRPRGEQDVREPGEDDLLSARRDWYVTLKTNCGDVRIRLAVNRAPKTASSFAYLARRGFYDGLPFHRVVADFVVQGGDPQGTGQGGPGYEVVERPPRETTYTRGTVAMAKAQVDPPGASGSQFFIVTAQDAQLPAIYGLVGGVVSGMDTVDKIAAQPVDAQSVPLNPVVIEDAEVSSEPGS